MYIVNSTQSESIAIPIQLEFNKGNCYQLVISFPTRKSSILKYNFTKSGIKKKINRHFRNPRKSKNIILDRTDYSQPVISSLRRMEYNEVLL